MHSLKLTPDGFSGLVVSVLIVISGACTNGSADRSFEASGTVEMTDVRIAAKTSGTLIQLLADEGHTVRQGDTLAVIEHDLLELQIREAEAARRAAEARLALLQQGARREDIAQAEARLAQVELELRRASTDLDRVASLFSDGSTTQQKLDDAQVRVDVLNAQRDGALQAVDKLKSFVRPEELRVAVANLDQADAAIAVLARRLSDAIVVAPLDGVITGKHAEAGELVTPGTAVMTVTDLTRAYLRIYVPENLLGKLQLGQTAEIRTDTPGAPTLDGRISFLSPQAEFTPKNIQTRDERVKLVYEVKIDVPNPDGVLKPGMYADAFLTF